MLDFESKAFATIRAPPTSSKAQVVAARKLEAETASKMMELDDGLLARAPTSFTAVSLSLLQGLLFEPDVQGWSLLFESAA